jgi:hypothetical protein
MNTIVTRSAAQSSRGGRRVYLAALGLLQVALLHDVAPRIAAALALDVHAVAGMGASSAVHAAGYALTLFGAAVALAFPSLALARHVERGQCRFRGLPRTCIGVMLTGALLYAIAQVLTIVARAAPTAIDASTTLAASSIAGAGVSIMAAGSLVAEVLRRSIAPVRVPIAPWHCQPVRIEVIDPPELATRSV